MKYKVSLLPESYRKRLLSKNKIEKIKVFALVVLLVLLAFLMVVLGTKFYAEKKLTEIQILNNEYAQKVSEFEKYRTMNAELQSKINTIKEIQVEEPQLYNFVATLSNLEHPGVSIDSIECTNWKTSRNCVLTGTATSREEYIAFEESLKALEGVTSVSCVTYLASSNSSSTVAEFTVNISCSGGKAIVTTTEASTATTETTAAAE